MVQEGGKAAIDIQDTQEHRDVDNFHQINQISNQSKLQVIHQLTHQVTFKEEMLKKEELMTKDLDNFRAEAMKKIKAMNPDLNDTIKQIRKVTQIKANKSTKLK